MKSTGQKVGFWLGMGITVFFVGWALIKFDFSAVGEALGKANYIWILPAAIIETLLIYIRAVRWRYFLEPIKPVSYRNSFMATSIGFFANMVLPARIGEFLRAWILGKKEGISKSATMGTVVIERAIDGLSVSAIMIIVLLLVEPPDSQMGYWQALEITGYSIALFYILFFVMLYLLYKRVRFVEWAIDTAIELVPDKWGNSVRAIVESFRSGFDVLENGHHVWAITIWSIIFWGIAGGINIAFFYAFGLYELPFIATYLILMSQVAGSMVPSSPGFVGPYHATTMAGLFFYGIEQELALSVAIIMHATMFLTNTLPGMVFLWLEKMSFSEIKHQAEEGE